MSIGRAHPDAKPPYRQPAPGPDGVKRCRWCWQPVGRGRRSYCGTACAEECTNEIVWSVARARALRRDKGCCQLCGFDSQKLGRIRYWAKRMAWKLEFEMGWGGDGVVCKIMGTSRGGRDGVEVDHIRQRNEGGNSQLDNLRTLCNACHAVETAKYAATRALRARNAKAGLFVGGTPQ